MKGLRTAALTLVVGSYACSDSLTSIPDPDVDITVATPQPAYRWDDVTPGEGLGVVGIITNQGSTTYYARLGDAFSQSEEPEMLYAAAGSDAFVDRAESGEWVPLDRPVLIEGVKVVPLTPGSEYTLNVYVMDESITGRFRLRVRFGETANGATTPHEAVSPEFEIH